MSAHEVGRSPGSRAAAVVVLPDPERHDEPRVHEAVVREVEVLQHAVLL